MRVKVKKTRGVTGNQHNYGLVTGSIWNYEDQPTNNTVGTTLSPVPREDANIEAERGETIVFPDSDGDVAHAKIGGKRHSQGGTPLNVPDGSFVFSDFRGLLIKNKEVLKDIFNISGTKSKTPAEIAKKYEINSYKEILKDPWADPMDKKTAQLMIENNMKKLGQLALIQEGMKGFPDGIPDIAAPLMGSDIAQGQPIQQEQGMPMARYGGLPKAQDGKTTNADLDKSMRMQLMQAKNRWNNAAAGSAEEKQAKQYLLNFLKANPQYAKLPSMAEFLSSDRASSYSDIGEIKKTVDDTNTKKLQNAQKIFGRTGTTKLPAIVLERSNYTEADKQKHKEKTESGKIPAKVSYDENLMNRMATEYLSQYPDSEFPTSLPEDDPIKAAQVAQANKIYRDAVVNAEAWQDPQVMLNADKTLKSDAYNISGWSTPLGMIGEGTRYVTQGLMNNVIQNPLGLSTIFGREWTPYNLESYNPWGKTWQEKITDMGDVLENRASKMKNQLYNEKINKQIRKQGTEGIDKLNKSIAKAKEIIANPSLYTPEQLSTASDLLYNVNNDISQVWYKPTRWMGYDPNYLMQKDVERPLDMSPYNTNQGILSTFAGDPYTYVDKVYNSLIGPAAKDAPKQLETKANNSASNPYPESNYFDFKTGSYLNGATDATATVLKEQAKVNQVDKKLRDNDNIPYEEKIGNKYVQYIRKPNGKIAALFIPKPSTDDVAEGKTQEVKSDSTSTRNTSNAINKDEVKDQTDDSYTTVDESNDLFDAATGKKKKFGGQQEIISYDPVKKFEVGGQLNKFVGGGGKHTQLIKETAIKPTDEYEVIMPNKKVTYAFGTQKFDSTKNYYTAINKTTGKEEELDLNDFINRQTDVLKAYDGGIDKWKTDVLSTDKATREKAAGWFQENYNTWRKANGLPEYFITKSGSNPYGKDKKLGIYTWSAPGIKKKVKADVVPPPPANTPPPAATTPSQPGAIPAQNYEQGIAGTPWWNYDLVNYGSQLSNYFDINPGELPTFMNYVPYVPDPTFLDPARAIAQQQGVVRGTQEAMMSGSDPTVARANMIAASAGAAPQIANIMAQYDERNASIANQYESSRAQILNQAQLQNQQFEKQYRDELEVRRQQYENALREGRTNVAKSIMQGLKNAAETSWVNATSDSYAVDPGTGQVYFKRGFDPLKGSFRSQTGSIADAYEELLNKGWSDEQARAILELQVKSKLPMNKSEAQYGGSMYNPMDLLWND